MNSCFITRSGIFGGGRVYESYQPLKSGKTGKWKLVKATTQDGMTSYYHSDTIGGEFDTKKEAMTYKQDR